MDFNATYILVNAEKPKLIQSLPEMQTLSLPGNLFKDTVVKPKSQILLYNFQSTVKKYYRFSNKHTWPKPSAMCVQRFDDSRNSAIHITYRISLRSSSLREPRDPLSKVVYILFNNLKSN